jgi:hypothetical protein
MITVVIIASDKRADLLRDFFQPLMKAQISIDSDYEQGLKSVFDKRPALVFIQGEINGVSGGAVAKQIKGLLRDAAPRIVLMGDAASLKEKARSWYDDSLNFSVTDEELVTVFREQLTRHLPGILQEAPALSADISEGQAGSGRNVAESGASVYSGDAPPLATPSVAPSGPEPVRFRMADSSSIHLEAAAIPTPVPAAGARVISTAGKADAVSPSAEIPPVARPTAAKPAPAQPRPAAQPQKPAFPEPSAPTQKTTPFEPFFPARGPSRHNPWLYIGGLAVAVVLAALAYYFTHPSRNGQAKPAASVAPKVRAPQPPTAHPETGARIARLPEIIPLSGRDPGYEMQNPGWSRYAGNGMEFKVFRDKGEIKAIQAIAGGTQSIPEDMPKRVVGQIFGYASYSSAAPVEKQDYLVQQSRLPGGAEMLVYRKKSTNGIRGIVISVP